MSRVWAWIRSNIPSASEIAIILTALFIGSQTCSLREQVSISNNQLELFYSSARPFVHMRPTINSDKTLEKIYGVSYLFVNDAEIPARIICSNIKVLVSETDPDSHNNEDCNTPRVIYKTDVGDINLYSYRFKSKKQFEDFNSGKGKIELAACVTYSSLEDSDDRRWRASSRHVYHQGGFNIVDYSEDRISPKDEKCEVELTHGK